jgi:hypothetical protein
MLKPAEIALSTWASALKYVSIPGDILSGGALAMRLYRSKMAKR